jgi:hypothetical protein
MDYKRVKDDFIGKGVKRLRYEKELQRRKGLDLYELGLSFGLTYDETIMLGEIIVHSEERAVWGYIDKIFSGVYSVN